MKNYSINNCKITLQPTEDKYSMVPLRIKGFLPQQNGSAIMLPAEITTLSGSDFDVDKLYIMLPEFNIIEYNKKQARLDYAKEDAIFKEVMSKLPNSQLVKDILDEDTETFNKWFERNKDRYKLEKPIIRKVEYNWDKSAKDNGLKARNNLIIDLMWGILTNKDTTIKMINPGGFDPQKSAARIVDILEASTEKELSDALSELGIKISDKGPAHTLLGLNSNLSVLNKLAEKLKVKPDPLSPRTQVLLHQRNMTGGKMIGIYANHNANHALIQHTDLELNDYGTFVLNGDERKSLHDIKTKNGGFITRNVSGFLAASVDNVKDPVLASLNQNTFTADASMLLARLGYNPTEIGVLMAQPIVKEITQAYFRESRDGKSKNSIIESVIRKYKALAGENLDITYEDISKNMFYLTDLAENILISKEATLDRHTTNNIRKLEYYNKQVQVGFLFKRIMSTAEALGKVVQATRADTQGGAAGPTIADSEIKLYKLQDLLKDVYENYKFPLNHAEDIILDNFIQDTDTEDIIREKLLESNLPFLQAFYSLGLEQSRNLLGEYFPQFTLPFRGVIDEIKDMTKSGRLDVKTINNIYNDLFAYIMSKTEFFGKQILHNSNTGEDTVVTSNQRRDYFINKFPAEFKKIIEENPDIANLEFIKRLKVIRPSDNNPVSTIIFKNVGQLSPILKERYTMDWEYLLYSDNSIAQQLALNLFRYSYYRNGFAFGPNTFIHLAPVSLRKLLPGYTETLNKLLTEEDNYMPFVTQYIYNHLDNRKLVPEIPDTSDVEFLDDNGDIKDSFTVFITEDNKYKNDKFIKEAKEEEGTTVYTFMDFVGKRIRGKWVYYKIDRKESGLNTAKYYRISPLGFRNSFIEYEYGISVEDMESVIKNNEINNDPSGDTIASFGEEREPDTNTMPDYEGLTPTTEELIGNIKITDEILSQEYGIPTESSNEQLIDLDAVPPNPDYRDANGNKLCK